MKEILLTQGKATQVDDEDYEFLNQWKWCVAKTSSTIYAKRRRKGSCRCDTALMHRDIMKPEKGLCIDHIDGNGLNNQKSNLRFCTHTQNMQNSKSETGKSRYKGVNWLGRLNKWKAEIRLNKRGIHLGVFLDDKRAALFYDEAARLLFGEFAQVNFPQLHNKGISKEVGLILRRKLCV